MMINQVWIEMPAVGTGAQGDPVRPKYPVQGKAFLMHQAGKVYVAFQDKLAREAAEKQAECRRLTPSEARTFEESLPFPIPLSLFADNHDGKSRPVGLGDVVSWLTRRAGIAECSACQQRKRWLNRIPIWGWWRS